MSKLRKATNSLIIACLTTISACQGNSIPAHPDLNPCRVAYNAGPVREKFDNWLALHPGYETTNVNGIMIHYSPDSVDINQPSLRATIEWVKMAVKNAAAGKFQGLSAEGPLKTYNIQTGLESGSALLINSSGNPAIIQKGLPEATAGFPPGKGEITEIAVNQTTGAEGILRSFANGLTHQFLQPPAEGEAACYKDEPFPGSTATEQIGASLNQLLYLFYEERHHFNAEDGYNLYLQVQAGTFVLLPDGRKEPVPPVDQETFESFLKLDEIIREEGWPVIVQ